VRTRLFLALGLALALGRPSIARADGEDLAGLLNESVVTAASNSAETSRDAPATSTVITGDALRKYGVRTLTEALDLLALGTMSGKNGSGADDIGARGVSIASSDARHFLVLVDGVRANGVAFGTMGLGRTSGIPLEIVDHVEVILGPGSVLYGSNAMLGVINVVTKSAKDFSGARVGFESELLTSVRPWAGYGHTFELGSTEGEVTGEFEYFKQWGPSLYVQPAYGGIDPATGNPYRYTLSPTGTGTWGGADATTFSKTEGGALTGRARLGKFELSYNGQIATGPTNTVGSDFGTDQLTTHRRLLLNLTYADQLTPVMSLRAHAYLNASDDDTTFYSSWEPNCPDSSINCRLDIIQEGVVRGLEVTPSVDWFKNGTFVTLVGGDAEWQSARSVFNEFNAASGAPVLPSYGLFDRQMITMAAYAQQAWNPLPAFGLNLGGRLDYDPRFSPVFSPRVAARVDPWRGGTLKVIYSQAFRAPSFYENYFSHPLEPAAVGLRPEYEQSVEGSVEQRFSAQRLLFGVFATHWTDLIDFYQFTAQEAAAYVSEGKALLPPAYVERNLSSIRNWGFDTAFDGQLAESAIQYGVTLTAAVAMEQDTGSTQATPLPVAPRAFGNAHLSYDLPGDLPTIALAVGAQSARPFEGAFTSGFTPAPYAPAQAILHATVSGQFPAVHGLSYRVSGLYATADREPYRAGPAVGPSPQTPSPSMVPIDRARVLAGLTYEF